MAYAWLQLMNIVCLSLEMLFCFTWIEIIPFVCLLSMKYFIIKQHVSTKCPIDISPPPPFIYFLNKNSEEAPQMYLKGFPCLDEWMRAASRVIAAQIHYLFQPLQQVKLL